MNRTELERDVTIDPGQLDVEAIRQADIFFKWAERQIDAKSKADKLEQEADVLEARLQMRAREEPKFFGIINVTEAAIKAAVRMSPQYVKATDDYFVARKEAELLGKAVMAMEQRKRMLELLVTLHGQQYFAGPSVPRDLLSAWQEHRAKQDEAVNDRQRLMVRKRVRQEEGDNG